MKVVYGIGNLARIRNARRVVSVGVFDGIHRGHQKILLSVVAEARRRGLESVVVTFMSHPNHFLKHCELVPALTSLEHKLRLIAGIGIDLCCVLSFDDNLAKMSPENFIKNILIEKLGMVSLYVGEDFVFGKGASGDKCILKNMSSGLNFSAHILKHLKLHGRIVSSTLIRALIKEGNLKLAEIFLGRRVSFLGDVIKGEGRGRKLGFPTANISPHHEVLAPDGIYAAEVICGRRSFNSLAYLGSRPTFKKGNLGRSIEVYLFDVKKNLYGKKMEIVLVKKIRNDERFPSAETLVSRMKLDVTAAKKIFSRSK